MFLKYADITKQTCSDRDHKDNFQQLTALLRENCADMLHIVA